MINKEIKAILSKQFGVSEESIDDDSNLVSDLGADSLDIMEITMTLEKQFQISIDDSDFDSHTVLDLINLVDRKLTAA
jgi:acyl carrier protein